MAMEPPEDGLCYPTLDGLIKQIQEHAAPQGYAVVQGRSKRNKKDEKRKVWLRCDRGGRPEKNTKSHGKRVTGSRLIDCPFKLTASLSPVYDGWIMKVENGTHNHGPTLAGSHPSQRRLALTPAVINEIANQTLTGSKPAQIISNLRLNEDKNNPLFKNKDIYNIKQAIRERALGSLTPTQALLVALHSSDEWFVRIQKDSRSQRLRSMFFCQKSQQEMLKLNFEVLILDATYKTNRYRLPLLVITGVTALNTSFYAGFAFMSAEHTADYEWVLQQLMELYDELGIPYPDVLITDAHQGLQGACANILPGATSLLCIWHVNNNVEKHCLNLFANKEDWEDFYAGWQRVIFATTLEEFTIEWDALQEVYREDYPTAIIYLADKLINPLKHKFVAYWTNQATHFNNRATSRGESNNGKLKRHLHACSTGNLHAVVDSISVLLKNEYSQYLIEHNEAKMRLASNVRNIIPFRDLFTKVSPFALEAMRKQYNLVRNHQMKPCTGYFTTTMGLPCAHKIEACMNREPCLLKLEDIHSHWYLKEIATGGDDEGINEAPNLDDLLQINEPAKVKPPGRPPGSRNKRRRQKEDTRRDPSGFEYAREVFDAAMRRVSQSGTCVETLALIGYIEAYSTRSSRSDTFYTLCLTYSAISAYSRHSNYSSCYT